MNSTGNTGLRTDLYWQEETVPVADGTEQNLTQEDFFSLLTEQLANQDPTKPVDNDQMVAQMTSFTMADGIQQLNQRFESFAASMTSNQALQASSLIGQDVLVQGNVGYVGEDGAGFSGVVVNDQTLQDMQITIENQYGEIIKTIDVGTQAAGNIEFKWDGTDAKGNPMPSGEYVVRASGKLNGEGVAAATAVNRHVGSVSLAGSGQGIILNLDGDVSINLDDVIQIGS
ncbi:flagellar hook assembly protein FlgD [Alteromonas aestuariivivens]|uniref:Basal-body rod modification protein FlgD n=1 Tax=Alteromonas aestuariivivens TaxID=1938339 RepID=A0A3D8M6E8_9ALTE|nr:flagellar hook assembly protein FlgD [Alteromonas aestuariivivens]RDV25259.1 flagellar hook assembly protein FlgD [Alteromonas aestuariivivens]